MTRGSMGNNSLVRKSRRTTVAIHMCGEKNEEALMSWYDPDREDDTIYKVVINHEE